MRASLPLIGLAVVTMSAAPALSQTRAPSGYDTERREAPERPEAPEQDSSQDLVRQLNLRSDQRAAFRDYQQAFQAGAQGDDAGESGDVARLAAMTTPQRLDDEARHMDQDRASFERISAATRRFYGTLDSAQRRTFDQVTAPRDEPDDEDDGGGPRNGSAPPPR